MLDISWVEFLFVAVLAIVIIGPKDLPKVFSAAGRILAKAKRMHNDLKGSIMQLQREVDIDCGKVDDSRRWQDFLPDDIKQLPSDFVPGEHNASYHKTRREQVENAKRKHQQSRKNPEHALTNDHCEDQGTQRQLSVDEGVSNVIKADT
ncbi:twin-arginine translocase TatA/TatE family subunit [Ningiella sp. W23]|uniref:Sec-independent protein translocase subunit TatA/TatB n=1 Tax=Ningiella sp. W23 TaxID=3023715 RepID=UPI0037574E50